MNERTVMEQVLRLATYISNELSDDDAWVRDRLEQILALTDPMVAVPSDDPMEDALDIDPLVSTNGYARMVLNDYCDDRELAPHFRQKALDDIIDTMRKALGLPPREFLH